MAYDGDERDYAGPWGPRRREPEPERRRTLSGCLAALAVSVILWHLIFGAIWDALSAILPPHEETTNARDDETKR